MSLSRRGIFGLFAAAPVAAAVAKAPAEPAPKAEFFVGQIRTVHSHFEPRPIYASICDGNHSHAILPPSATHTHAWTTGMFTESVAVTRYEQWDGKEWRSIDEPRP